MMLHQGYLSGSIGGRVVVTGNTIHYFRMRVRKLSYFFQNRIHLTMTDDCQIEFSRGSSELRQRGLLVIK